MAVNLGWQVRSSGADEQRVYRSTSPFDGDSLPAALATLDADATTYSDSTVATDTEYFYRVAAVITGSPDVLAVGPVVRIRTLTAPNYLLDGATSGNNISDGAGNQIKWG